MPNVLRTSTALLAVALSAAASCSNDKSEGGLSVAAGSGGSGAGAGGKSSLDAGSTEAGAAGAAGAEDMAPGGCTELVGLGECGVTSVEAEYRTANILLVIDKSGSMTDQPDGFDTDKWVALKTALDQALNNVPGEINFGLVLYPFSATHQIPLDGCKNDCCEVPTDAAAVNVPIQPSATSTPLILDALNNTEPGGGTPTAAALQSALDYFTTGDGAMLTGDRYVLLATDGGPNCNMANSCDGTRCTPNLDGQCSIDNCCSSAGEFCLDDQSVVDRITELSALGIPTFVVGIPGTEQYATYLDDFAVAGGVTNPNQPPQYYAVSAQGGVQALTQTFTDITTHLVRSCDIALTEEPPDLKLVNVAVDCEAVPFEDGAGWELSPADHPTSLILKGDTCSWIETMGASRVDVVYGCPTLR
jgi:hypothetical protein